MTAPCIARGALVAGLMLALCGPCAGKAGIRETPPLWCALKRGPERPGTPLSFFDLVTEVIDLRSFSNLWYWIVLAILWSALSHRVLGVPHYIVQRARNGHDESRQDMETLAEVHVRRLLNMMDVAGPFLVAVTAFVLTGLAVLGWGYRVEFCQAVFLLSLPMVIVGVATVLTAMRLRDRGFENLAITLRNHRLFVQVIGLIFIFITAFWGMFVNVRGAVFY